MEDGRDPFNLISSNKCEIKLTKPIHVGFANYEISKVLMNKT